MTAQKSAFFLFKNNVFKALLMLIIYNYLTLKVVTSQTSKLMFSLSIDMFSSLLGLLDCMRTSNETLWDLKFKL